jgi:hypothetical protein
MSKWGQVFEKNLTPFLSFSPQYVFETNYDYDGHLAAANHYVYVTLSYTVKLFK